MALTTVKEPRHEFTIVANLHRGRITISIKRGDDVLYHLSRLLCGDCSTQGSKDVHTRP